jgi:quercetin dioxygenase-like cupin family protein
MKPMVFITSLLLATQCAGATSTAAPPTAPPAAAPEPVSNTGYLAVTLPTEVGEDKPVEPQVVADTPHVKTVVITLRDGATLPVHSSTHPAIIQALSGHGHAVMGEAREPLSPARMLLLDPGVKHEVVAAEGTDLVLLVHHMKKQGSSAAPDHDHDH